MRRSSLRKRWQKYPLVTRAVAMLLIPVVPLVVAYRMVEEFADETRSSWSNLIEIMGPWEE